MDIPKVKSALPLFWPLVAKNFLGYFVFFVSPTAATDNWERYRNGDSDKVLSEEEKSLRVQAFFVGMALGPFLLFFGAIFIFAILFDYIS